MNRTRRQALALLGSTMLTACGAPAIVTREKNDPFEGGIGGTGIVGTLNGFGSLLINGLTVALDGNTQIRTAFGRASQSILEAGQVLTVSAQRTSSGISARDVSIDYALVGRLHQIGTSATVNGIPLVGWQDAIGHGAASQRVAVSGVWTAAGVRPSRIDPAPHGLDLIAGTFDGGAIGRTQLDLPGAAPANGTYAVALGRAVHGGFSVERLHSGRFATLPNLRLLSVDGYLEPSGAAPGFRIAGLGHSFARDARLAQIGARRALYFGPYTGRFDARRGYIVPDRFSARQNALSGGLSQSGALQIIRI